MIDQAALALISKENKNAASSHSELRNKKDHQNFSLISHTWTGHYIFILYSVAD